MLAPWPPTFFFHHFLQVISSPLSCEFEYRYFSLSLHYIGCISYFWFPLTIWAGNWVEYSFIFPMEEPIEWNYVEILNFYCNSNSLSDFEWQILVYWYHYFVLQSREMKSNCTEYYSKRFTRGFLGNGDWNQANSIVDRFADSQSCLWMTRIEWELWGWPTKVEEPNWSQWIWYTSNKMIIGLIILFFLIAMKSTIIFPYYFLY